MPSFFEELWQSIFVPEPTPVLMMAANATFGLTLSFLVYMTISTSNIHYGFLSVICASLWACINWFVRELRATQAQEEREKATKAEKTSDDSDTEVEPVAKVPERAFRHEAAPAPVTSSSLMEPVKDEGEVKARLAPYSARSAVSTEDEWEKVSEGDQRGCS